MVLVALDPNDPQPLKDDPRFAGDKKAFRKADKAWNGREQTRRKKLKAEHAEPPIEPVPEQMLQAAPPLIDASLPPREAALRHPKPRGQAPRSDGVPCTWDYERGCWLDERGQLYKVRSDAERAADTRLRDAAVRERTAQELTVLCGEIDAKARRFVLSAGGSLVGDRRNEWVRSGRQGRFEGEVWQQEVPRPKLPPQFRPDWSAARPLGYAGGSVQRSQAYFDRVGELLAAEGSPMSLDAYKGYLRDAAYEALLPVIREVEAAGSLWKLAIEAKPKPEPVKKKIWVTSYQWRWACVHCGDREPEYFRQVCTTCRIAPSPWCCRCAHAIEPEALEQLRQQEPPRVELCSGCQAGTTDLAARYAALRAELDAAAAAKAVAEQLEAERKRQAADEWQRGEAERQRQLEERERLRRAFQVMQAGRDAAHSERVTALSQSLSAGSTAVAACIRVRVAYNDARDLNPEWLHRCNCLGESEAAIRVPMLRPCISLTLQTVAPADATSEDVPMWKCTGHCGFERRMTPAEVECRRAARLIEAWEARRLEARAELWRRRGVNLSEEFDCDQSGQAEGVGDGSSSGSDEECASEQEGQSEEEEQEGDPEGIGLGALSLTALKRVCAANHLLVSGKKSALHERLRLASEHGRSGECPRCRYSQVELVCPAHEPNVPCRLECRHWRGKNDRCGWMRAITPTNKQVVLWLPLVDSRERDLASVGIAAPVTPHAPPRQSWWRSSQRERAERRFLAQHGFDDFLSLDDSTGSISGLV